MDDTAGPGEVVQAHLAAFSAGDVDLMLATPTPFTEFVTDTTRVDPKDLAAFFGGAVRELSSTMQVVEILVDGERVACRFIETLTRGGRRQRLDRAAFSQVRAGRIVG